MAPRPREPTTTSEARWETAESFSRASWVLRLVVTATEGFVEVTRSRPCFTTDSAMLRSVVVTSGEGMTGPMAAG